MAMRLLREPLLHFGLIGLALFVAYGWMNPAGSRAERIVVTRAVVEDLARQHEARWMRAPTEQELANLVESHVRDEMLFREGVSLGLDRDDPVIKRRVRQKLDVLAEEKLSEAAPTDSELMEYMSRNPSRFLRPATVSFEHVFLDAAPTDADGARAAAAVKGAIARGADPARLGRPTPQPRYADAVPLDLVSRDFGSAFAGAVMKLPVGEWTGPLASGLGAHLVRVDVRMDAVTPSLDAVRGQVTREWENERRERSRVETYRRLRGQYDIVIEPVRERVAAFR